MVMQLIRSGTSGGLIKYFLFGIVGLSVGGLALMDVRGVLQGKNVGGNDVTRIGEETISISSFDRTVRRALEQYRIAPDQAYRLGLVDEILSGQIRTYLLKQEAKDKGFELSKAAMAKRVAEIIQPNMRSGQTLQQALEELLQRQGMSEDEFVSALKREIAGEYLMQAVRSGYSFDEDALAEELFKFQNQTRDIQAIFFADKDIEAAETATEEQLKNLYESVKSHRYKIPEYRKIKIAIFDPKNIDINVEVSAEEVNKAYNDNQDRFIIGETVILSQSLVDTPEQAKSIHDEVQAGKSLKEAVVLVTGSEDKYYEERDFDVLSMIPEMAEAIDGLEEGAVTTPVKTMLGYHVVRLDRREASKVSPLEDVQKEIEEALIQEKRDEEIYKIFQEIDESLDRGISFEDLANEEIYPLTIKTIEPFDQAGLNEKGEQGLGLISEEDKKEVLEISYELAANETSLLQEIPSGMIAAFKLEKVMPETYKPFKDVKKELAEKYVSDRKHANNFEVVAKHLAELGTGGSNFEGLARENNKGIMNYKEIGLSGELPSPLNSENADSRPAIFQTAIGGYEMIDLGDQFALIRISGYTVPEITQDDNIQKAIEAVAQNLDSEMEDDAFLMYLTTLAEQKKPSVNNRLLKQVYDKAPQQ